MTSHGEERSPRTQPAFSRPPPRPPKVTARDLADQPDEPGKIVYLVEPVVVKDLATGMGLKPFQVVADLIKLKLFKSPEDTMDFETASSIARKHGYRAARPPPGMLVL
jgi:translation initiation factor IF-2